MEDKKQLSFGEKNIESIYDKEARQYKDVPVWKSPKYAQSKQKAIELIEKGDYGLEEGDFWILMNATKNGKMAYTGLIISHTACLKINDKLLSKFNPDSVVVDKEGYKQSLVFTYSNTEQLLYEVGEVSEKNCKNDYPYAMGFKRLFDRVVLKLSKISFAGIYSEAESEDFKEKIEEKEVAKKQEKPADKKQNPLDKEKEMRISIVNFVKKQIGVSSEIKVSMLTVEEKEKFDKVMKEKFDISDINKVSGEALKTAHAKLDIK